MTWRARGPRRDAQSSRPGGTSQATSPSGRVCLRAAAISIPPHSVSRDPARRPWVVSRPAFTEPRLPVCRPLSTVSGPARTVAVVPAPGSTHAHSNLGPATDGSIAVRPQPFYGFSRLPRMGLRTNQLTLMVLTINWARPGHVRLRASECRPRATAAARGRFTLSLMGSWGLRITPTGGAI